MMAKQNLHSDLAVAPGEYLAEVLAEPAAVAVTVTDWLPSAMASSRAAMAKVAEAAPAGITTLVGTLASEALEVLS